MASKDNEQAPTSASSLPAKLVPMLARSTAEPFDSDLHLFEIKWDGTRALAFVESGRLRLQNRRLVELGERYPEFEVLRKLPSGTLIDGEVVVLAGGKPSFAKLAQREHVRDPRRIALLCRRLPATLIAFDILFQRGRDVMKRPLVDRKPLLAELVRGLDSPHVIACDFVIGPGRRYFSEVEKIGLEGIMAKRLASAYQPGKRSDDWLKIKVATDTELDVIGFTLQGNAVDAVGALLLGEKHGARWLFRGKVGTGFTDHQRREFFRLLNAGPRLSQPPTDGPKDGIWRRTGKRCVVRYFEKTEHGMLRGPVFHGWARDETQS